MTAMKNLLIPFMCITLSVMVAISAFALTHSYAHASDMKFKGCETDTECEMATGIKY